jgi:CRISPR-associated protein Cmr1
MSRDKSARRTIAPPPTTASEHRGDRLEATLRFITPMFGGGVKLNAVSPHHKEHDGVTPVRGASLRGQLRTWWRRTAGAGLSPTALRAREAVLWGWASTQDAPAKGVVSIAVDGRRLQPEPVSVYETNNPKKPIEGFGAPLAYGAFPLQPAQRAQDLKPGHLTRLKGEFTARVELLDLNTSETYRKAAEAAWAGKRGAALQEALWAEVQQAWLAFVTFGGLGGRTRRGFGAVQQTKPEPLALAKAVELLGWRERLASFTVSKGPEEAQKLALSKLQGFRQAKGVGRNDGNQPNRPGRSRWPEPDQLRRLSGTFARFRDYDHRPEHTVRKLPRAAFGLPIIVQFKDAKEGDPEQQTIQPQGAERLASPLILRPVQDSSGCFAVALKLPGEAKVNEVLMALMLRAQPAGAPLLSGSLTTDEQAKIRPLAETRTRPDAGIDAVLNPFLNYFKN